MKRFYMLTWAVTTLALASLGGWMAEAETHAQTTSIGGSSNLSHANHDDYLQALGVMDKFLSDWQNNDAKAGVTLLSARAKKGKTMAELTTYFANRTDPAHAGYEVVGYKAVGQDEFEFHVWMYGYVPGAYGTGVKWSRPKPQIVTVVRQAKQHTHSLGQWYINNLPKLD